MKIRTIAAMLCFGWYAGPGYAQAPAPTALAEPAGPARYAPIAEPAAARRAAKDQHRRGDVIQNPARE